MPIFKDGFLIIEQDDDSRSGGDSESLIYRITKMQPNMMI